MAKNHLSNSQIKMFNEGTTGCQKLPVSVTKHPSAREKKPLVPRGSDRVASYRGSKSLTQKERHRKLCRTPRASIDLGPIQTIMWKDFPRWNWMEFVFLHCQQASETLHVQFQGKTCQGKFTIFESSTHFCSPYKFCINYCWNVPWGTTCSQEYLKSITYGANRVYCGDQFESSQ